LHAHARSQNERRYQFFSHFHILVLLLLVVRCFIRHAPHWVPDLFHFYTGKSGRQRFFLIIFFLSFTMFRPMRTLMDAHLQDIYTDIKQASTSFITFFNFFLRGYFAC